MVSGRVNKVLFLIIIILLISNAVLLGIMFLGKKGNSRSGERGKSFTDYFEQHLGFSPEQSALFQQMRDKHFENMRPILREVRLAKDSLFSIMRLPDVPDSMVEKAADNLAQKEKAQELQSFRHFKKVRDLCTEEQKPKFDSLISRIINRSYGRSSGNLRSRTDSTSNK